MRKGIPALLLTLSLLLCGCRLLPERIPPAGLTVHFIDVVPVILLNRASTQNRSAEENCADS